MQHKNICDHCGKEGKLITHHLMPRWLGGLNGETVELCQSCHSKYERLFENFVKYGSFKPVEWINTEKRKKRMQKYRKRFRRVKHIFGFSPVPLVRVGINVHFNLKTRHIGVGHHWSVRR